MCHKAVCTCHKAVCTYHKIVCTCYKAVCTCHKAVCTCHPYVSTDLHYLHTAQVMLLNFRQTAVINIVVLHLQDQTFDLYNILLGLQSIWPEILYTQHKSTK